MPFVAILALVFAGSAAAAALDLSAGVTLTVPDGWRGAVADATTASLVGPDGDSTIIVSIRPATPTEVEGQLTGPIDLGRGIVLAPMGQPQTEGEDRFADFTVTGTAKPARAVVRIRTLAGGRAFALVGIVPVAAVPELRAVQGQIMASAQFRVPVEAASSSWTAYLRGRYLVRLYSGNGYSEKHELWLCSDGSFASAMDGGGFTAGVASGAFGSNSNGTWVAAGEVTGAGIITLMRTDGQRGELRAEMTGDNFTLNGERWLRGDNNRCR